MGMFVLQSLFQLLLLALLVANGATTTAFLDKDLLELSLESIYYTASLFDDYSTRCPPSQGCSEPSLWNILAQYEDSNDAALVARTDIGDDHSYCVVAFRGTTVEWDDWWQNLDPRSSTVCSPNQACCSARAGFADGFYSDFSIQLEQDAMDCMQDCNNNNSSNGACQLVLTGHSQGGAIAAVAAIVWEQYNPLLITFGQPATFVGSSCSVMNTIPSYRFVNTIVEPNGDLEYDPVPFIAIGADHSSPGILLGEDTKNVVLISDDNGGYYAELFDADYDAHRWRNYILRFEVLVASSTAAGTTTLGTNGWELGFACNVHSECVPPQNCYDNVCQAGRNGQGCNTNSDCQSGRCEGYTAWVTGGTCYAKLGKGAWCDESSDCQSNRCRVSWRGVRCR